MKGGGEENNSVSIVDGIEVNLKFGKFQRRVHID